MARLDSLRNHPIRSHALPLKTKTLPCPQRLKLKRQKLIQIGSNMALDLKRKSNPGTRKRIDLNGVWRDFIAHF